jgi:hypothetical protein
VTETAVDILLVGLVAASVLTIRIGGPRWVAAMVRSGRIGARQAALLFAVGTWLPIVAWAAVFTIRPGEFDPLTFALIAAILLAGTAVGARLVTPFVRDLVPKPPPGRRRERVENQHERRRSNAE